MPIDTAQLTAELTTDPAAVGYAAMVASGNDAAIVAALNATSAAVVSSASMTRDDFLTAILPAGLSLATKDAATQAKWDRLIGLACAANTIVVANIAGLLQLAVGDGLLTADQAGAVGKRSGSRAEVLFGADTIVSLGDVSFALRGDR
jgi:hypothetical protein